METYQNSSPTRERVDLKLLVRSSTRLRAQASELEMNDPLVNPQPPTA